MVQSIYTWADYIHESSRASTNQGTLECRELWYCHMLTYAVRWTINRSIMLIHQPLPILMRQILAHPISTGIT